MRATVQTIDWTPGSGLASLVVLDEDGNVQRLHADAGPLFRSAGRAGLRVGSTIECQLTPFGTLAGFNVVED